MPEVNVQVDAADDDGLVYDVVAEGAGGTLDKTLDFIQAGNVDNTNKRSCFVRFASVTIPVGATITVAYLSFCARATANVVVRTNIWGNDTNVPASPAGAIAFWALVKTANQLIWDGIGAWIADTWYNSDSIVAIIQELVDSYDYSAGLAMQFMWWNDASDVGARRSANTWEVGDHSKATKLHIEYTGGRIQRAPAVSGVPSAHF